MTEGTEAGPVIFTLRVLKLSGALFRGRLPAESKLAAEWSESPT